MQSQVTNRRDFLKTSSLAALAGASLPYWFTSERSLALGFQSANERPVLGAIGTGDRWRYGIRPESMKFADVAAVCDVDTYHLRWAQDLVDKDQAKAGIN